MSRSMRLCAPRAADRASLGIAGGVPKPAASRMMRSRITHSFPSVGCAPARASEPIQASNASRDWPPASASSAMASTSGESRSASTGGRTVTTTLTRAATGRPFRRAGSNCHQRTASTAAESYGVPPRSTRAWRTSPSESTRTHTWTAALSVDVSMGAEKFSPTRSRGRGGVSGAGPASGSHGGGGPASPALYLTRAPTAGASSRASSANAVTDGRGPGRFTGRRA
jgi:hypothetical protein